MTTNDKLNALYNAILVLIDDLVLHPEIPDNTAFLETRANLMNDWGDPCDEHQPITREE